MVSVAITENDDGIAHRTCFSCVPSIFLLAHIFLSATRFFFSECHSCFGGIDHRSFPVEKSLKKIRNITCILQPVSHLVLNYKFSAHTHTQAKRDASATCPMQQQKNSIGSIQLSMTRKKNVHGNRKMMSSAHKKNMIEKIRWP